MADYTLGTMRDAIDPSCYFSGASTGDKTNLINKVREIFYYTPEMENVGVVWKGTEIALALTIFENPDGCKVLTLPRGVETLIGVYDGCGTRIIQNQWYSYLRSYPQGWRGGRGWTSWPMVDLGDGFCGVVDLPSTGAKIKVVTTSNEAGSLHIRFTGTDSVGNAITENLLIPTVSGNVVITTNTFYSVIQVIKSTTVGNLEVYSEAGATDTFFAQYLPGEAIPNYRRYTFNTSRIDLPVMAICKRRYELLVADNDPCEVSSVLAFESGLRAYHWFRNNDMDAYRDGVKEAINYLNAELSRFQADTETGTVRMQMVVSGGRMRNLY